MWLAIKSKYVPLEFGVPETKFKKVHKIKRKVVVPSYNIRKMGQILVSLTFSPFTIKQLLVWLKIVKPALKKISRFTRVSLFIAINTILTRKPKDTRMGRGKGAPTEKVHLGLTNQVLFEFHRGGARKSQGVINRCSKRLSTSGRALNCLQW